MRRIAVLMVLALALGLAAGALAADKKTDAKTDAAVKAAKAWLALVDAGKYDASWDQAAALFKNAVTKAQWRQAITAARGPLGANTKRTLKSATYKTELPGAPDGEYVVIQFSASFAKKKSAVETITPMKDADGAWRVSGYFIK